MEKKDHRITYEDMQLMISVAKTKWVDIPTPLKISKKTCIENEPAHVAMVEAVIMYLNNKGLLNTFVKMDYDGK